MRVHQRHLNKWGHHTAWGFAPIVPLALGRVPGQDHVVTTLPGVSHQLCQFHYLREAATPVFEANRHAKKKLKKQVRGIWPIERPVEGKHDEKAELVRGYAVAVRSALTEDGQAPLDTPGLRLHERLNQVAESLRRVEEKGAQCHTSTDKAPGGTGVGGNG